MENEFTHTPFNGAELLERFSPYPASHDLATHLFGMHELVLRGFDQMHKSLEPILSIRKSMEGFGVPGGALNSVLGESAELKEHLASLSRQDRCLQAKGSKSLAYAMAALTQNLAKDGADGDVSAELCNLVRGACIGSLPERCKAPWLEYCQQIEIAIAASGTKAPSAPAPRL